MNLSESKMMGFVSSQNLGDAKIFYSDKLGLQLLTHNEYALEYKIADTILRITKVSNCACADYTVFGWQVNDIHATAQTLVENEVEFLQYSGMDQDKLGVCEFPGGSQVAWFKDVDGNILSLTQFSE